MEVGVIASVKENYAFILCAEREGELFFHMSDLTGGAGGDGGVRRGDEVSFVVAHDGHNPAKLFGKRVTLLPPGSVAFEEVEEEGVRGVVEAELGFPGGRKGRAPASRTARTNAEQKAAEGYGGRIRRTGEPPATSSAPQSLFEFAERDLVDPALPLAVGDAVSFSVFVEKKSRRRGATAVRLVQLNPAGRQRGVVSVLKEGFGFIRPEDGLQGRSRELFFHFSSLLDANASPAVGDELEYVETSDGGRVSASRIAVLPKGTIRADAVSAQRLTGVLEKDLGFDTAPPASDGGGPSSSGNGSIRSSVVRHVTPAGASVVFPFTSADCRDSRPILLQGDEVSFSLLTKGKTGQQRATQVALLTPFSGQRERGVVVTVNASGGFAFIRRAERDGELFLHASNYRAADSAGVSSVSSPASASPSSSPAAFVAEGTEVEFNVHVGDNGRPCAVRAVSLPPGSVQFEEQWDGRYRATVTREPRKRKDRGGEYDRTRNGHTAAAAEEPRGELRVTHLIDAAGAEGPLPTGEAAAACAFSQSASPMPLLVGDTVECTVAVHRSSGLRVARQVRLLVPRSGARERGLISQLHAGGRTGRIASPSRTALLPFDAAHFFDTEEAKQLQQGSAVEFDVVDSADPSSSSSSPAGRRGAGHERERKIASRLRLLPPGSFVSESIDRAFHYRGKVDEIPSNPKKTQASPGHITVLSSRPTQDPAEVSSPSAEESLIDLSSLLSPPAPSSDPLSASLSSLSVAGGGAPLPAGSSVPFTFKDIVGHSFLARGDVVEFFLSTTSSTPGASHAADVTLLPLTATVSSVAGESALLGQLSLMSVSSTSASSSSMPDETLVYAASDVEGGAALGAGDVVQVSAMSFHAERKRRQAKQIRLVRAAPKSAAQMTERRKLRLTHSASASAIGGGENGGSGGSSASSPTSVVTQMRFARGPDETRGFAPRRSGTQQGIAIGLQRIPSAQSQPQLLAAAAPTPTATGAPVVDVKSAEQPALVGNGDAPA